MKTDSATNSSGYSVSRYNFV